VPTIATSVPRAAFAWVTQKMKAEFAAAGITTPLVTSNRINTPEVAEQVLADGCADMVSMARPLLADAAFVKKAAAGPGRPHQHLHCLQPGLSGPCVSEQDQQLPGEPARLPRDRAGLSAGHRAFIAQAHCRGRRRARRPDRCHGGGRARA
jgi:2,4-dienoyl-CoA reductase (EC 1.3.1.34)